MKFVIFSNEKDSSSKLMTYLKEHYYNTSNWSIDGEYTVNNFTYINGYSLFKNDKVIQIDTKDKNPIADLFGLTSNYIPTEKELALLKRTRVFNLDSFEPEKFKSNTTFNKLEWDKIQSPKELEYSKNMKAALYFYTNNLLNSYIDGYNHPSASWLELNKKVSDLQAMIKEVDSVEDKVGAIKEKNYLYKMINLVSRAEEQMEEDKDAINDIIRQYEQRYKTKKLNVHYDPALLVLQGIISADNKVLDSRRYLDYLEGIFEEAEEKELESEGFKQENVISHTKLLSEAYDEFKERRKNINWENFKKFFPKEMQYFWNGDARRQFVGWKFQIDGDGKVTKIPVDCNHSTRDLIRLAKANEEINCCFEKLKDENGKWILDKRTGKPIPDMSKYHPLGIKNAYTWSTLDEVIAKAEELELDGIGFEAGCGIGTLDVDSCIDKNGNLSPLAEKLLKAFDTFATKSPSGTGLHLYFNFKPTEISSKLKIKTSSLEAYLGKLDKDGNYIPPAHFFAEAGLELEGAKKHLQTLKKAQETVDTVLPEYLMPTEEELKNNASYEGIVEKNISDGEDTNSLGLSSEEIIEKLTKSFEARKNQFFGYNKFEEMYHFGNWELFYTQEEIDKDGQSQADLNLCNMIAFYTDSPSQIDSIFRNSALMRNKWDKVISSQKGITYGERTIALALNNTKNFKYNPNYRSKDSDSNLNKEAKASGMEMD